MFDIRKIQNIKNTNFRNIRSTLLLFLMTLMALMSFSNTAMAQNCWTSVGSAGVVRQGDLRIVALDDDTMAVNRHQSGTVNAVFNITDVGRLHGRSCLTLSARLADTGNSSQVLLRLRKLNIRTGQAANIIVLDSNNFAKSGVAQHREVFQRNAGKLDFRKNVYHIVAELRKTRPNGNPLVRALQLCASTCID